MAAKLEKFAIDLIARDIQHLDRSKRQAALKRLLEIIQNEADTEVLNTILNEIYLHLLKCYYDKFESCRALAIAIVSEFVHKLHGHEPFFYEFIIPAVRKRIGLAEMHEPSEEIQLQLLQQIAAIVSKCISDGGLGGDRMARVYDDIVDIVMKNLANCFGDAQKQCCEIVKALAIACTEFRVKAECLVDPLIGMLKHRQSSSRIAAIETLG